MTIKPAYCHTIAVFAYLGLFALLMLWNTLLAPSSTFPVALMLLITITPLLLPMRGFLNRQPRSCSWMAYVSLAYFVHGSVEAYANDFQRLYPSIELILSLLLFFGANFFVRLSRNKT